jgi:AcrR family transcriptional regulator
VTRSARSVTTSEDGRAERLVDAAAELLLRHGYQRVTIDDVARHAGVGKGTVYLHFRTKEALFLTVLLRSNRQIFTGLADGIAADPVEALPSRFARNSYLAVCGDPIAALLYLGDADRLGRLVIEADVQMGHVSRLRSTIMEQYIRLLRAAGAVRTDLEPADQLSLLTTIRLGFHVTGVGADPGHRGDLLAHAVGCALETPDAATADLATVAPGIVSGMRSVIDRIDEELARRVR